MPTEAQLLLLAFPVLFIGLWLFVGLFLGVLAGWFRLRRRFPAPKGEVALFTLRGHTGSMGLGVHFNGVLDMAACPSGLRLSIWPLFCPFCRPILVPWDQIRPEEAGYYSLVFPHVRLQFGRPAEGRLTLPTILWHRLAEHAPQPPRMGDRDSDNRALGRGLIVIWEITSLIAGGMFAYGVSLDPDGAPAFIVAFPAVLFAILMAIQYLRMRRP
jgi:hypothetical protein